ncbi:MAG: type I DNA topoisomerase [Cytophagales bacterium]|nr:type I DNA topoisomerase [Bernardetiaceae bacterium]MDW8204457.1 type I DNA topoisomerase [Cytophagales bacterium]
MPKNLVIVESPAKAKTIEGYLGKDYIVKSSYGHVRDLPKTDDAIDIKNNFTPRYEISEDKREIVSQLAKLAKESDVVWLATDDDREGEAISWHLYEALHLDRKDTRRIVFREITKSAIQKAIQQPRGIDIDLVNAQQARRILDRLVGFELSPILWKKVKGGLSAGRVQSVAVRLIVEREREIIRFTPESDYKITAVFTLDKGKELQAELPKRFKTEAEAEAFLQRCIGANFFITNLEKKPAKKSPAPPFTTSTLQQEASTKLRFGVSQTMRLAQKLYEAGHISYMRTDSVNLSDEAMEAAANTIKKEYGEEYHQPRRYKTKSESAQEAHEAIRPTDFSRKIAGEDRNEQRLYELIWKRAIASQMADAKLERTTASIGISTTPEILEATGEVVLFDGFLKVYMEFNDNEEDEEQKGMLPPLQVGQILDLKHLKATERFSRPPARYTEASLVKKLEELGIGRPSTYAPTITTIQERGYVVKESREGKERTYKELTLQQNTISKTHKTENTGAEHMKLFPTDLAMQVNDFLVAHFPNIIDYSFTAKVEEEFDHIAEGKTQWQKMIENFYKGFHKQVEDTEHNADRASTVRKLGVDPVTGREVIARLGKYGPYVQLGSEEDGKEKPQFASLRKGQFIETITLQEALELLSTPREGRLLGYHPENGKELIVRVGKYGPYVQLGGEEDGSKPQYASLRKGQSPEKITLEEALELFKLPREVGQIEGKPVVAAVGRFGPYVSYDKQFFSLPKDLDPLTITIEQAKEVIEKKQKAAAEKVIKVFPEDPSVRIMNGRWGAYIEAGKQNIRLPKGVEPTLLSLDEVKSLIAAEAPKSENKSATKSAFKKVTASPKNTSTKKK